MCIWQNRFSLMLFKWWQNIRERWRAGSRRTCKAAELHSACENSLFPPSDSSVFSWIGIMKKNVYYKLGSLKDISMNRDFSLSPSFAFEDINFLHVPLGLFLHFWAHPVCDILNQHETVFCVSRTAFSVSLRGEWVFYGSAYVRVCLWELSPGLVSFSAVHTEMLIWIAYRGQCHGCRSDSYPSPWSSFPVNIITTRWQHTHAQQARTHKRTPTSCSSKSALTD